LEFQGFHGGETDDVILGFGTKAQNINIKVELLLDQRNLLPRVVQAYGLSLISLNVC
jgi:hypothetical protein